MKHTSHFFSTSFMPHFGQLPGLFDTTAQVFLVGGVEGEQSGAKDAGQREQFE
jgi:hypothetical protein